jgi:hypothetical protein
MNEVFVRKLKKELNPLVEITKAAFARPAVEMIDGVVRA